MSWSPRWTGPSGGQGAGGRVGGRCCQGKSWGAACGLGFDLQAVSYQRHSSATPTLPPCPTRPPARLCSEVYALWADRLNWPHWFSMIEEVGFKEGDDDICALNMWYRWGE